jgi:DNA-directed RNA polymerase specialized sigma24 family protein
MKQRQMGNVTGYLRNAATGDPIAEKQLFELIYSDLKRMAHGRLWRNGGVAELKTTMLVHESYLKFVQNGELSPAERPAFIAYVGRVMRSVLVDYVRERQEFRATAGSQGNIP